MVNVCFYFQVHQPFRLRHYSVFDIGEKTDYFDDEKNKQIAIKVANKCYLPMNALLLHLIQKHQGRFKVTFSITGTALEQFEQYCPQIIESFQRLAKTGCVEFLSETYYHSLSYLYSKKEFQDQIKQHSKLMKRLFKYTPTSFRDTELIFNNELGKYVEEMGFKAVLAEGADHILGWRSPNFIYRPATCSRIKLLLKNYKLSDDIAFRFSNRGWEEWPLTVDKYIHWLNAANGNGETINLFMDYETFGEHQWEDTGIFQFMEHLPDAVFRHPDNTFMTVSETADAFPVRDTVDMHNFVSWADMERDLSAWRSNKMQDNALREIYAIENIVKRTKDEKLIDAWKKMTTSDHYYYMCTKWFSDGDVHKYFNPYESPYDAYITFMNIINDMVIRSKGLIDIKKGVDHESEPEQSGSSVQNHVHKVETKHQN